MRSIGALVAFVAQAASLSSDECLGLGFSEGLLCKSCDRLAALAEDEALVGECNSCCRTPSTEALATHARLDVCK